MTDERKTPAVTPEYTHQQIAILLLYVYRTTGRTTKVRVLRQSRDPTTHDVRLVEELRARIAVMDKMERKFLLSGNNNTAHELSTWWKKQSVKDKPTCRTQRASAVALQEALSSPLLPTRNDLDLV